MFLSLLCLRQVICVYILPIIVLGTSLPDLFSKKSGVRAQDIMSSLARAGSKSRVPSKIRDFSLMIYTEHDSVSP